MGEPCPRPSQETEGVESRKSDIMLTTCRRAKFKKGGVWGGFKGFFHCAGVLSAGRAPRPFLVLESCSSSSSSSSTSSSGVEILPQARVGRPLAFRRDSPPSRSGPKAPWGGGGGGGGGGGLEGGVQGGAIGGGGRSGGSVGGGVQVGRFGVVRGGGGHRLPLPPLALPLG